MAPRGQAAPEYRRHRTRVGDASLRSQFDQQPRCRLEHQPMGEGDVLPPGAGRSDALRVPEQRCHRRIEDCAQAVGRPRWIGREVPLGACWGVLHSVALPGMVARRREAGTSHLRARQVIPPAGRSVPAVVPRCRVVSLARTILIKPCVERAEGISGWRICHAGQDPGSGTMTGRTARAPDRRLAAASKEDPLMLERKVAGLGESYVIPGPGTARLTVCPASCA